MFYYLSKTLDVAFFPLTWIALLLVAAAVLRRKKIQAPLLVVALSLLFFFGNNWVVRKITESWEPTVETIRNLPKNARVGVVLSGVVDVFRDTDDRIFIREGSDRILHAAFLYRRKIIDNILVTGAFVSINGDKRNEAEMIKSVLMDSGVDEKHIWLETDAKNTYENAANSRAILRAKGYSDPIVLITSAFHMRRAAACFRKQGFTVAPFPVDFQFDASGSQSVGLLSFIPSSMALSIGTKIIREMAGYGIYFVRGYL